MADNFTIGYLRTTYPERYAHLSDEEVEASIEQDFPDDEDRGIFRDLYKTARAGMQSALGGLASLGGAALSAYPGSGLPRHGRPRDIGAPLTAVGEALSRAAEASRASRSPAMRRGAAKDWVEVAAPGRAGPSLRPGPAFTDPYSYASLITESLPAQLATMGASRLAAVKTFNRSMRDAISDLGVVGARRAAEKAAGRAAMVAGGAAEGLISAGYNYRQTIDTLRAMPEERLRGNRAYSDLRSQGRSHEEAVTEIARNPALGVSLLTGSITGVLGGPVNLWIGNIGTGKAVAGRARQAFGTAGAEAVTEMIQGAQEQVGSNVLLREYMPNHSLWDGVLNEMVAGGIAGGATGFTFGAAFHVKQDVDARRLRDYTQAKEQRAALQSRMEDPARPASRDDRNRLDRLRNSENEAFLELVPTLRKGLEESGEDTFALNLDEKLARAQVTDYRNRAGDREGDTVVEDTSVGGLLRQVHAGRAIPEADLRRLRDEYLVFVTPDGEARLSREGRARLGAEIKPPPKPPPKPPREPTTAKERTQVMRNLRTLFSGAGALTDDESRRLVDLGLAREKAPGPGFMRLYRASDRASGTARALESWTPQRETAQAYTQEGIGRGGPVISSVDVPEGKTLDTGGDLSVLARELGYENPVETAREWMDSGWRYPWEESGEVRRRLLGTDYDYLQYEDDFPDSAVTVVPLRDAGKTPPVEILPKGRRMLAAEPPGKPPAEGLLPMEEVASLGTAGQNEQLDRRMTLIDRERYGDMDLPDTLREQLTEEIEALSPRPHEIGPEEAAELDDSREVVRRNREAIRRWEGLRDKYGLVPEVELTEAERGAPRRQTDERTPEEARPEKGGVRKRGDVSRGGRGVPPPSGARAETALEGLPSPVEVPGRGPVEFAVHAPAREAARAYMESTGRTYTPVTKYAKLDKARAKRIADAFEAMEHTPNDPRVRESYEALAEETLAQYQFIKQTGLKVEFIRDDMDNPYRLSPRYAILDVIENNHMWVFATDSGFGQDPITPEQEQENPLLRWTDETVNGQRMRYNDVFRVVHDYFGHVMNGNGFRAEGEENAWRSHVTMYSHKARPAMTTELRGQNSWTNWGPHGEANRTASAEDTVFADQKIGLMPDWVMADGAGDEKRAAKKRKTDDRIPQEVIDHFGLLGMDIMHISQAFEQQRIRRDVLSINKIARYPGVPEHVAQAMRDNQESLRLALEVDLVRLEDFDERLSGTPIAPQIARHFGLLPIAGLPANRLSEQITRRADVLAAMAADVPPYLHKHMPSLFIRGALLPTQPSLRSYSDIEEGKDSGPEPHSTKIWHTLHQEIDELTQRELPKGVRQLGGVRSPYETSVERRRRKAEKDSPKGPPPRGATKAGRKLPPGWKVIKESSGNEYTTFGLPGVSTKRDFTEEDRNAARESLEALFSWRERNRDVKVLADGIPREFRSNGFISLVGRRLKTGAELAALAQIYRDPRFETLNVYLVRGDEIVHQMSVSSRLPGASFWPERLDHEIKIAMIASGADGFWLSHNHPSGEVAASPQDVHFTKVMAATMGGFKGHIILNHDRYGTISPGVGRLEVGSVDTPGLSGTSYRVNRNPRVGHRILSETIKNPEDLARLAALHADPDRTVIMGVDSHNRMRVMASLPKFAFFPQKGTLFERWRMIATLRRIAIHSGTRMMFAVTDHMHHLEFAVRAGVLMDVYSLSGRRHTHAELRGEPDLIGKPTPTVARVDVSLPTPAQAEAGNYPKRRVSFRGLRLSIETAAGHVRRRHGWSAVMRHDYGQILGTHGADGGQLDVFVSNNPHSDKVPLVYIINQIDQKTGRFDEHKVMLGFSSIANAISAYRANYPKGWKVGSVHEVHIDDFKQWVGQIDQTTKQFTDEAITPISESVTPYRMMKAIVRQMERNGEPAFESEWQVQERKPSYGKKKVRPVRKSGAFDPSAYRVIGDGKTVGAPGQMPLHKVRAVFRRIVRYATHPLALAETSPMWYVRAGAMVRDYSRGDEAMMERMVRLLAYYSPLNSVPGNFADAVAAAYAIAAGDWKPRRGVSRQVAGLRSAMEAAQFDRKLSGVGNKVVNFYRNLRDAAFQRNDWPQAITADRHIARVIGYDRDSLDPSQYKFTETLLRQVTEQVNEEQGTSYLPSQIQAMLWTYRINSVSGTEPVDISFREVAQWHTQTVHADVIPSESFESGVRLHRLTAKEKMRFTERASQILMDGNKNLLAEALGIVFYKGPEATTGGWAGKTSPSILSPLLTYTHARQVFDRKAVDLYSMGWQFIFSQDEVPWMRPAAEGSAGQLIRGQKTKRYSKGFVFRFGSLPTQIEEEFFLDLKEYMSRRGGLERERVGYTRLGNSILVTNYRGEDGKPISGMSDEEFAARLDDLTKYGQKRYNIDVATTGGVDIEAEIHKHDWTQDHTGESLLEAISSAYDGSAKDRSDLLDRLRDWRAQAKAVAQEATNQEIAEWASVEWSNSRVTQGIDRKLDPVYQTADPSIAKLFSVAARDRANKKGAGVTFYEVSPRAAMEELVDRLVAAGMSRRVVLLSKFLGGMISRIGGTPFMGYHVASRSVAIGPRAEGRLLEKNIRRSSIANLAFNIAHEFGHAVDWAGSVSYSDTMTSRSPLFHLDLAGDQFDMTSLGSVIQEAVDYYRSRVSSGDFIATMIDYPLGVMRPGIKINNPKRLVTFVQTEMFAQLFAMFYVTPEQLRQALPRGYRLMEEVHEATSNARSRPQVVERVSKALRALPPSVPDEGGPGGAATPDRGRLEGRRTGPGLERVGGGIRDRGRGGPADRTVSEDATAWRHYGKRMKIDPHLPSAPQHPAIVTRRSHLPFLSEKVGDLPIRGVDERALSGAIERLRQSGFPGKVISLVDAFVMEPGATHMEGGFYVGTSIVSMTRAVLRGFRSVHPAGSYFTLAHEMTHALDYEEIRGSPSDLEIDPAHSTQTTALALAVGRVRGESRSWGAGLDLTGTGPVMKEMIRGWNYGDTLFSRYMDYPFAVLGEVDVLLSAPTQLWLSKREVVERAIRHKLDFIVTETFAQIGSLYYVTPSLLRENAPAAFRMMEEIDGAINSAADIGGARPGIRRALSRDYTERRIQESRLPYGEVEAVPEDGEAGPLATRIWAREKEIDLLAAEDRGETPYDPAFVKEWSEHGSGWYHEKMGVGQEDLHAPVAEQEFYPQANDPELTRVIERADALLAERYPRVGVRVVRDVRALPGHYVEQIRAISGEATLATLNGFYDPLTEKTYIIAANVLMNARMMRGGASLDSAVERVLGETIAQEVLAHHGLRDVLGTRYGRHMDAVAAAFPEEVRRVREIYGWDDSPTYRRYAAEEVAGYRAAEGKIPKGGVLADLLAAIKRWLIDIGFGRLVRGPLALNDSDLQRMLARTQNMTARRSPRSQPYPAYFGTVHGRVLEAGLTEGTAAQWLAALRGAGRAQWQGRALDASHPHYRGVLLAEGRQSAERWLRAVRAQTSGVEQSEVARSELQAWMESATILDILRLNNPTAPVRVQATLDLTPAQWAGLRERVPGARMEDGELLLDDISDLDEVRAWADETPGARITTGKVTTDHDLSLLTQEQRGAPRTDRAGVISRDALLAYLQVRSQTLLYHEKRAADAVREEGGKYGPGSSRDEILRHMQSKIGRRPETMEERISRWRDDWSNRMQQGLFDRFHGIKAAARRTGFEAGEAQLDPYIMARLTTSLDGVMRAVLQHGWIKWVNGETQVGGDKGLLDILAPIANIPDTFGEYMAARRAKRLMTNASEEVWRKIIDPNTPESVREALIGRGRERNFKWWEIREALEHERHFPVLKRVAREYAEFKSKILDFAGEAGVINPETRPLWDHAEYIPFWRIRDDRLAGPLNSASRSLVNLAPQVHRLKGGGANIIDPIEGIMKNFVNLIDSAMKNNAAKLAIDTHRDTGLVEKAPKKMIPAMVPASQLREILADSGMDVDTIPEDVFEGLRKMYAVTAPKGKQVVSIWHRGKREYYEIYDELLHRSIAAINMQKLANWPRLMRALRLAKRIKTASITAAPPFWFRNAFRDTFSAWVQARDPGFIPVVSTFGNLFAGSDSREMISMMAAGAAFDSGYINAHDPESLRRAMRKARTEKGIPLRADKEFMATVINTAEKAWDAWLAAGAAFENASRIGVYKAAIRAGKNGTAAAYEAKDLLDFSMGGDWAPVQFLIQTVIFTGARLQGLHRMGRGFAEHPLSFFLKGLMITAASLALWAAFKDDERYKALDEWERDIYYHWWIGDRHFRLPKPFEVGAIFSTVPERIMERLLSKEGDADRLMVERGLFLLGETFSLNPIPQLVFPINEMRENWNFFMRRPIVPDWMEKSRLPEMQYRYYTSPTFVELSKAISGSMPAEWERYFPEKLRSPLHLENLWRGYFGTVGMTVLAGMDAVTRRLYDYPAPPARTIEDWPIVGSFVRHTAQRGTKYEDVFYDLVSRANEIHSSMLAVEKAQRSGEPGAEEQLRRMEEKYRFYIDNHRELKEYRVKLTKLNRRVEETWTSREMSPAEKRRTLDELMDEKLQLLRETWGLRPGADLSEEDIDDAMGEAITGNIEAFLREWPLEEVPERLSGRSPAAGGVASSVLKMARGELTIMVEQAPK